MGVTIHYSGSLSNAAQAQSLLQEASAFATKMQWGIEAETMPHRRLTIFPHPDCEPLILDPDDNGLVENWVKTQFSGPEIHIQIVDFLSRIAPYFASLTVEDEAEYWETRDRQVLERHMNQINDVIRDMQQENPASRIQVREATGRIVDLIN